MLYLIGKGLKGKNLWLFLSTIFIAFFQVVGNTALPIMMNFLTEIIIGKGFIHLAPQYYEKHVYTVITNHPFVETLTSLTTTGERIEAGILISIMFGIAVGTLFFGVLGGAVGSNVAVRISREQRVAMYNKIQYFSNADLNHFDTATLITRLTSDVFMVQEAMTFILRVGFRAFLMYLGGIAGTILVVCTMMPKIDGNTK